jgi:hypothetical protein
MFGGLGPQEASRRAAVARAEKQAARKQAAADIEQDAVQGARTFRQRLGVSLAKLSQDELDALVARMAKAGNANALARLADQAFGRPSEQDDGVQAQRSGLSGLSRDELAATLAGLDALPVSDAPVTPPAPTPASAGPPGENFSRDPSLSEKPQTGSLPDQGERDS